MNEISCDVAIIGGGPVGAALALALQGNDLNVVLLEARESEVNTTDPRALALSYGSRLLLQRLGAGTPCRTSAVSRSSKSRRSIPPVTPPCAPMN